MASNVTYLLGAGASCKALPLAKDFRKREGDSPLNIFRDWVNTSGIQTILGPDVNSISTYIELQKQLIAEIDWLVSHSVNHETVDTFAKKLFITGGSKNPDLYKLKRVLASFFITVQYQKSVDSRYDTFFASVIELVRTGLPKLPGNIKIISWNYDIQIEKGLLPYIQKDGNHNIYDTHDYINAYPKFGTRVESKIDLSSFNVVNLNGKAGFFFDFDRQEFSHIIPPVSSFTRVNQTLDIYKNYKEHPVELSNLFCFAWEKNPISEQAILNAIEIAKQTDVLIIVGYSFPFFNREIDKRVLNSMDNLHTVYYQVPSEDFNKYRSRLSGIIKKPMVASVDIGLGEENDSFPVPININDKDQFFIPYDL